MANQICEVCPFAGHCYNYNSQDASEDFSCLEDGKFEEVTELNFEFAEHPLMKVSPFHN